MFGQNLRSLAEDQGGFDHVQKLAYVPRPIVPSQELQGRFADLFAGAEAPVEHGHEVLCQQVHVPASGAQGRHLHRDRAQAVKRVL